MIALEPSGLCFPTLICPAQIVQAGGGLVGSAAASAAGSMLQVVGDGLNQAAAWLAADVIDLVQTSSHPDLGAGWFLGEMALMTRVMMVAVLPLLMAGTIGPVLRQDGRQLLRVWGVGLPVAVLAGLSASQFTGWGVTWTDALCTLITGPHSDGLGRQFAGAITGQFAAGSPLFVQMTMAVLTLCGALLVWLELIVRSAGVYVATFFMPLALAAYIWPATAGVAKRAVQILVSLILSKFVVIASLSLGAAAIRGHGIDAPMAGAAILLMAGFAPFALLRLAPVVEASAIAHLEGLSRRPMRAAAGAATSAASAATHPVTQLVMSAAQRGEAAGGLEPRLVTSPPLPPAEPDYPFPPASDG